MDADRPQRQLPDLAALCWWVAANCVVQVLLGWSLLPRLLGPAASAADGQLWLGWLGLLLAGGGAATVLWLAAMQRLPRLAFAVAALLQSLLALAVAIDCLLYEAQAVHLDDPSVAQAWQGGMFLHDTHLGFWTIGSIVISLSVAVAAQWPVARLAVWLTRPPRRRWLLGLLATVGLATIAQGFYTVAAARQALSARQPVADALPLLQRLLDAPQAVGLLEVDYPATALASQHRIVARKSVVVLFVESLRADAMTTEWMPATVAARASLPCLQSDRHYSASHATTWAVFSALSGLDAWLYLPASRQKIPSFPLNLLKANGYRLEGVSASQLRGWEHGDTLVAPFHRWQEPTAAAPWQRDLLVTSEVKQLVGRHGPQNPLFLFGFLYAPHHNYHFPPAYLRHKPVLPEDYNHFAADTELAKQKDALLNRYRNAVGFADAQIAEILEALRPGIDRGDWVVVVAGDHGEEFWDHGAVGHGAARFWNARTQVPLLFCGKGLENVHVPLSSHTDLLPTIVDFLGVEPALPVRTWSTGQSLLHRDPAHRVAITGVGFPDTGRGLALVGPNHKVWLQRRSAIDEFSIDKLTDLADLPLAASQVAAATAATEADLRGLGRRIWRFLRRQAAVHAVDPRLGQLIEANFGGWLQLVGVAAPPPPLQPGSDVRVRLTFRVLAPPPAGYGLFVHVKSADGKTFLNVDGVAKALPLGEWPVGQFVVDDVWWQVPAVAQGELGLWLGLWHPQQGRAAAKSKQTVVDQAVLAAKWRVVAPLP